MARLAPVSAWGGAAPIGTIASEPPASAKASAGGGNGGGAMGAEEDELPLEVG